MGRTTIEWCDFSFNPWLGCTKVSSACDHCYAEAWAKRTGQPELWSGDRRRTTDAYWRQPLKWDRRAKAAGVRATVFCASLADVFDNQVPPSWRDDLWALIAATPNLTWLLLTKRPQNIAKMLPGACVEQLVGRDLPWPWPNVALGVTAENQTEADRRIPALLQTPARWRFVSCEPLLGPMNLRYLRAGGPRRVDALMGEEHVRRRFPDGGFGDMEPAGRTARLDLVIAGGESGPGARPMHPGWARSLRDQCAAVGVAFHMKQWGEWLPWEPEHGPCWVSQNGRSEDHHVLFPTEFDGNREWDDGLWAVDAGADHAAFQRVGKKRAGRLLDGRTHDDEPEGWRRPC